MSDNPIKFPSSPSSSEDKLPSHHSFEENVSSDDGMFDYSPPWSFEKESLEEEDEEDKDDANADNNAEDDDDDFDDNDDSEFDFASPPPKQARIKWFIFVALYIRGVQLVRLIVLSISSLNQCFVNKVNELNESVPMEVDRVVVVKAWDDMETDNDLVEVDNDLEDIMEIHNDPMEVDLDLHGE
ncbi:uncharacterized protein [Miscanthus floridulus]|uniref:uncharacterized protein n=1 Tax=Miscanthus floridulus TaxID=154761 RepID=UPI00345A0305